jgi:hypothetical protein
MSIETVPVPLPDADTIVYTMMDLMEYNADPTYTVIDAERDAKSMAFIQKAVSTGWISRTGLVHLRGATFFGGKVED